MLQLLLLARPLSGCIITSSACLPPAVIKALLSGGCKAVVCQESEAGDAEEPFQAAALFSALYEKLHGGRQLMQASRQPVGVTTNSSAVSSSNEQSASGMGMHRGTYCLSGGTLVAAFAASCATCPSGDEGLRERPSRMLWRLYLCIHSCCLLHITRWLSEFGVLPAP